MPLPLLRAAGSGTTGLLLAPLEAVATPASSPAAPLARLLTLLASRLLGLEGWAPLGLSLVAMGMGTLLLRLFVA